MLPGSSQTPSSISAKPPLVSLGLPVFNGADYLAEAIESILNQSLADFELILCDNASSDQTESICRSFAERDARVRYIRQARNLGAAANYNLAFEEARGTFFKWCAHDDNRHILVHETDPQVLTDFVDAFWADGWTAIDQGMRWGAA
ncbi:MAG: glycosyltransferase, partial [Pseudomonadota bacterium]